MATFKDRFKELRNEKGLTLKELGKLLDYSESNLSLYESGKREPKTSEDYKRIADFFGVTTDYLLGRSEYKKGRILSVEEMKTFLPEEVATMPSLEIAVDDKEQELSEETKKEIIDVLKKHGYIK